MLPAPRHTVLRLRSLPRARAFAALIVLTCTLVTWGCGGTRAPFRSPPEYEEEIYLALDGTATVHVNASVAALVALRGFDLDVDPRGRVDRAEVRRYFEGPGAQVTSVSLGRRDGRRFAHVAIDVNDIRTLSQLPPFKWSRYRLEPRDDVVEFEQSVGLPSGKPVRDVGWDGSEVVAFRVHVPSEILYHNTDGVQRGNILEWDQPLSARLKGDPLALEVTMEPQSILYSTLLLFGATIVAAAMAFAVAIWLIARKGGAAGAAQP